MRWAKNSRQINPKTPRGYLQIWYDTSTQSLERTLIIQQLKGDKLKQAQDGHRRASKADTPMANKPWKDAPQLQSPGKRKSQSRRTPLHTHWYGRKQSTRRTRTSLARTWRHWKPRALPVGMQNGAGAVETDAEPCRKSTAGTARSSNSTLGAHWREKTTYIHIKACTVTLVRAESYSNPNVY